MWNPRLMHLISLPVAAAVILVLGRDQWFFGDDWAVLAPRLDGAFMVAHVGHWNLVPALLFPLVRDTFGLSSYTPFLVLAVAAHLMVGHLVWRVLLRVGAGAWLSALLALLVLLLGAAAENLFWAFQFGFMGAIALGLAVVLLLDRERLRPAAAVAAAVLALAAPMFSGTALPVLAAAAVVGLVRHGWWRTLLLFTPAAIAYLAWFSVYGVAAARPESVNSPAAAGMAVVYAAAMYAAGLGRALPFVVLGVAPALAVAVWFIVTVRRGIRSPALVAYALVVGSVVFTGLTAYSRSSYGLSAAGAGRYSYLTIVLLLPALGILLTRLAQRGRPWFVGTASVLGAVVALNVAFLVLGAGEQAEREAGSRALIERAATRVADGAMTDAEEAVPPDATWSPDLLGSDVEILVDTGRFPVGTTGTDEDGAR